MKRRTFLKSTGVMMAAAAGWVPVLANPTRDRYGWFDPAHSYGRAVYVSDDVGDDGWREAVSTVIEDARNMLPPGTPVMILVHRTGFHEFLDEKSRKYWPAASIAWKYSPVHDPLARYLIT